MPSRFRFERTIAAPIQVVWDILVDHASYSDWTPMPSAKLVKEGADDPNGVGAVRQLGIGNAGAQEEVVAFDPPNHLAYSIIKGMPVRNHRADVRLEDVDGTSTRMIYEGSGEATVPLTGPVVGAILKTAVKQLISGLTKQAEARATK